MVILAIPLVAFTMYRINRHYAAVRLELQAGVADEHPRRPIDAVVVLDRVDESVTRAVSYLRSVGPRTITAVALSHDGEDIERQWAELVPDVPLEVVARATDRRASDAVIAAVVGRHRATPDSFTTAVVAETLSTSMVEVARRHRLAVRIKSGLVGKGVVVGNVTAPELEGPYEVEEPVEHHVVVLVSGVNSATKMAVSYAQQLHATSVRALSINLETEQSNTILAEWDDWDLPIPLELVDSPFRSLGDAVRAYVRGFEGDGRHTVVTCVLPEFVLPRLIHRPLHNQTALIIKATLILERGVVVTSVPVQLSTGRARGEPDSTPALSGR
jgi:hypothetical protein